MHASIAHGGQTQPPQESCALRTLVISSHSNFCNRCKRCKALLANLPWACAVHIAAMHESAAVIAGRIHGASIVWLCKFHELNGYRPSHNTCRMTIGDNECAWTCLSQNQALL